MNPNQLDQANQLDQLRETLRNEVQHIEPVGLGVATVQRRGRRRRNRGRAIVAAGAATCVAGLGVAVVQRGSTPHSVAVAGNAGAATPTLDFRVVTGTVAFSTTHFTSVAGVTYALSTAPGVAGQPSNPVDPGQTIYRTSDGEHWAAANQSSTWISDLSEQDGVLYAVGTAPGAATPDQVKYQVGVSHDNGAAWSESDLPVDTSAPSASVPLTRSSTVQIARGASKTVALVTEQFTPDLDALVAAHSAGHPNATTRQTAAGYDIVDLSSSCNDVKPSVAGAAGAAAVRSLASECTDPPALGTITWSEIGLRGPGDLVRQQVLVSADGTHWNSTPGPSTGYVQGLIADSDGFLLLAQNDSPAAGTELARPQTTLFHSTDAVQWTAVSTPADLNVQAVAGDRVIGLNNAGEVQTSADGGITWSTTNAGSLLPAGSANVQTWTADAGPLGFAVVANSDPNPKDQVRGHDYLLFSTDGVSWNTSDLAAHGEPANADPMQVTVGSDHIGVDYESAGPTPAGPMKITTLLATPQR